MFVATVVVSHSGACRRRSINHPSTYWIARCRTQSVPSKPDRDVADRVGGGEDVVLGPLTRVGENRVPAGSELLAGVLGDDVVGEAGPDQVGILEVETPGVPEEALRCPIRHPARP